MLVQNILKPIEWNKIFQFHYSNIFHGLECESEADCIGLGDEMACMNCKCVALKPSGPASVIGKYRISIFWNFGSV